MITITRATKEEAATISCLGSKTFSETFGYLFSPEELEAYTGTTFNRDKLINSLGKDENIYGIAHFNEYEVGYFKLKLNSPVDNFQKEKQVQLQKIYLLKDFINLKIGGQLMDYIFQLEEIQPFHRMWLQVLNTNSQAIRFYQKYGFVKLKNHYFTIGTRTLEYFVMIKSVNP